MKKTLNKAEYLASFLLLATGIPVASQEIFADEVEPSNDLESSSAEIVSQNEQAEEILGTTEFIEEESLNEDLSSEEEAEFTLTVLEENNDVQSNQVEVPAASITYESHLSNVGDTAPVSADDSESYTGTVGQSRPMEALQIHLDSSYEGSVEYRAHVANIGWQDMVSSEDSDAYAGTKGMSLPMEAVQIFLKGEIADYYDIYYRPHVANVGWLGWTSNGLTAGSQGYGYALEALQIKLVEKTAEVPQVEDAFHAKILHANAHVSNIGWINNIDENNVIGTTGQSQKLEAVTLQLTNQPYTGGIIVKSKVAGSDWESKWNSDGAMSGTTGESKPIEAVQIALYGEMANYFDIYYRVHVSGTGWLGWASNGDMAGSALSDTIEAIQIDFVAKNTSKELGDLPAYMEEHNYLTYASHSASGWQATVNEREVSGSTGQSIAIDGLKISLVNAPAEGGISYRAHLSQIGWQEDWKSDGVGVGMDEDLHAIEAIEVILTGDMADKYDILYRVHSANIGWLGWAKNGESAGSEGYGNPIEAIEIRIYDKDYDMDLGGTPFKSRNGNGALDAYDWIAGNFHASDDIAVNNAMCVWRYFKARGWSLEAVCGMLGNMQEESGINPGMWQNLRGPGYGLVQWTPAYEVTSYLAANGYAIDSGEGQCECLQWEMENEINWYNYGMSFHDYSTSLLDPGTLAYTFFVCYERGAAYSSIREVNAVNWFYFLLPYA